MHHHGFVMMITLGLSIMTFSVASKSYDIFKNAMKKVDYHTIEASKNLGASTFKQSNDSSNSYLKTYDLCRYISLLTGLGAYSSTTTYWWK